jgi:hypothetical protein
MMMRSPVSVLLLMGMVVVATEAPLRAAPAAEVSDATATAAVKTLLSGEADTLDRELAGRMLRRPDLTGNARARLELEIDLRIIQRSLVGLAGEARFSSNEQVVAWIRGKQFRDAVRGMDAVLTQDAIVSPSQKEALGQIHKLSFDASKLKAGKELDAFCKEAAVAMANVVNATPVNAGAMPVMRPKPLRGEAAGGGPPTVAELTQQVQMLAAVSVPLRQQLLALASAAGAPSKDDDARATYEMLSQSVDLARGLQSNTAVTPDARENIESQLAQGIALFSDPRTRAAGRRKVEALGQYRQTLARVEKMNLSADQMARFAPALAWARANPAAGAKVLGAIEAYLKLGGQWDALTRDVTVAMPLRRPLEDLKAQFAKQRSAFAQQAPQVGTGTSVADLQQDVAELQRLYEITDDVVAMGPSLDTLNAYKPRPAGSIERKVATAATAAVGPAGSANRGDGQKYLHSVHELGSLAQRLAARPLTDLPEAVAQGWAGGKVSSFEGKWKSMVAELAGDLAGGQIELDKAKVARLRGALELGDGLRSARQLEEALAKSANLSRWVDWAIDPSALSTFVGAYRDATAAAVAGFVADHGDALETWRRLRVLYEPVMALVVRDAEYGPLCEGLPIGLAGDLGRLATPVENAPFATERFASYSIGLWNALGRAGQGAVAEKVLADLANRLRGELRIVSNGP